MVIVVGFLARQVFLHVVEAFSLEMSLGNFAWAGRRAVQGSGWGSIDLEDDEDYR